MKLLAALLATITVAAAVIAFGARRKLVRREACAAWLSTQDDPAETSIAIFTDRPTWVDLRMPDTQWRAHKDLTMDLVLSDAIGLGPCAGVVVCAGERDLRDGVPVADVVGDLARLHDHLCSVDMGLQVVAVPRPRGRWGPAIDNLNNELESLCTRRNIPLVHVGEHTGLGSLIAQSGPATESSG